MSQTQPEPDLKDQRARLRALEPESCQKQRARIREAETARLHQTRDRETVSQIYEPD